MNQQHYTIEGMSCADCALKVEKAVQAVPGVEQARVDFISARLELDGKPDMEEVRRRVAAAGYRLAVPDGGSKTRPGTFGGFLRFLLARLETRLALLGGGLIVLAAALGWLGAEAALPQILQVLAVLLVGIPIARSGIAGLWYSRTFDINLLMVIAVTGAILIGELAEAAMLVFLFAIAEALEAFTTDRARSVLGEIRDLAPTHAIRLGAGGEERVPVAEIAIGERLLVPAGERIPLDGEVLRGWSEVNQAPITGESLPVAKSPGETVFAGTVNGSGALEVRVTRRVADTTLSRIIHLVEQAQSARAPVQRFIDRFAQVYTPAMVVLAALVAVLPPLLFGQPFLDVGAERGWIYRALSLLVIACPCALVISAPVTILSGIIAAARAGVVIKGGVHLESLSRVKAIAFDKTGTLTCGRPVVTLAQAVECERGEPCERCDEVLALASALERRSAHPLAQAVLAAAGARGVAEALPPAEEVVALNGRGLQGRVNGRLATVGSHRLFDEEHPHPAEFCHRVEQAGSAGQTTMLVCDGERVRGFLALADEPRPEAAGVVAELHALGLRTAMLSGDAPAVAQAVGAQLGLPDVRGGLLPEDKVAAVSELRREFEYVAMVGDGINDAPALAAATLGVALGGSSSAQALETADIVLMGGTVERLPFAIRLARFTRRLIGGNIAFSLLTKLAFAALALAGLTGMWVAVVGDVGVSLAVTLNGMRPLQLR